MQLLDIGKKSVKKVLIGFKNIIEFFINEIEEKNFNHNYFLSSNENHVIDIENEFFYDKFDVKRKEISAEDIMTNRTFIKFININSSYEEIKNSFLASENNVLLICNFDSESTNLIGKSNTNLIGAYNIRNFLKYSELNLIINNEDISEIYSVLGSTPIKELIEILDKKCKIIIVIDHFGYIKGLITVENIWNIMYKRFWEKVDNSTLILRGTTPLKLIKGFDAFVENFDLYEAKTFGGFIIEYLNQVPLNNFTFKIGHFIIKILDANESFLKKILVSYTN